MTKRVPWTLWLFLAATTAVRVFWAAAAPLANDEAYYWDWSRSLELSYIDHPPAVAWLAAASRLIFGTGSALGARGLVPWLHLLGVFLLLRSAELIKGEALSRRELWATALITELAPAFSLEGVVLLPDSVLLPALAASLYFVLRAAKAPAGTAWRLSPLAGLALGLSGLAKYHAAPIAAGLSVGLVIYGVKVRRLGEYMLFLLASAVVALLVTTPVWIWNATHDWASFRFQGAHGFSGLNLSLLAAGRFYFAQLLLLTPLVFIGGIGLVVRRRQIDLGLVAVAAALPLIVLLETLALGKQLLPHWPAPAFWILVPVLGLRPWSTRATYANAVIAGLITAVLPWVLTVKPLRDKLVASFDGRPGPLSELSLWDPLAEAVTADPRVSAMLSAGAGAADPKDAVCGSTPTLASLRWFWAAQLSYHLPEQPTVLSLDQNHRSYYHYRDHWPAYAGCSVLLICDRRHLDRAQLSRVMDVSEEWRIIVPSHQDTEVVAIAGRFRSRAELEPVAAAMHGFGDDHPAAY